MLASSTKQERLRCLEWGSEGLAALGIPDLQVWVDVNVPFSIISQGLWNTIPSKCLDLYTKSSSSRYLQRLEVGLSLKNKEASLLKVLTVYP